jgi:hypothetical protein
MLPNRYIQFRTINFKSPFDARYTDHTSHLIGDDAARCVMDRMWAYVKPARITYLAPSSEQDVQAAVQSMRTRGWAVMQSRLSGPSVDLIRKLTTDSRELYATLLGRTIEEAIIGEASFSYRDIKFREGRLDTHIPHMRRLFDRESHHAFIRAVQAYLCDLTPAQRALWDDSDVFAHIDEDANINRRERRQLRDEEKARNEYMRSHVRQRRAKMLFSSVVDALPRDSNDQRWHSDPHELTTEPSGVNVFIALQPVTIANGCTQVVDMTQREMAIRHPAYYDAHPDYGIDRFVRGKQTRNMTLQTGQICLLDSRLLHRGSKNNTQLSRLLLCISFGIADMVDGGPGVSYTSTARKHGYHEGTEILPDHIMP